MSTDRLVTAVWGADPPRDAVGALRAYVSRLRAVLPERLRWRAPGYALDVADGELDAAEFRRLTGLARERAAVGDHRAAVDLLDTALGLWRGEPLDEFDAADIDRDGQLAHLADLRLAAVEERAAGLLALGRGRAVVGELAALVERHPDRETLAALLMHALYASGRQADALAVYQDLRRRLVEELGVEPSDATRALHRRVLEQDPTLAPVEHRPAHQPAAPRHRAGRAGRRRSTRSRTRCGRPRWSRSSASGASGRPGSRSRWRAGSATGSPTARGSPSWPRSPTAAPSRPPSRPRCSVQQRHGATIEQTVVEYLAARSLLLVLDNCEHVLDAAARLAQRIVATVPRRRRARHEPGAARRRRRAGVAGAAAARPRTPPPCSCCGRGPPAPTSTPTSGAVAEICRRLDGLPLGIELAAARTRAMSAAEIAERLDDGHLLARGARTAQPRHQSLAAAIDWSYRLLDEPEQRLFARMSVFAGGADLAARARRLRRARHVAAGTLDRVAALVDKSMVVAVEQAGVTRYRMLETLRAYARERADDGIAHGATPSTSSASPRRPPAVCRASTSARGSRRRCRTTDNLRAAFEHAFAERDVDLALRLVAALPELTHVRGMYEADEWAQRSLDLADRSHPLFAAAVGTAARGAWGVGDFARADAARGTGRRLPPRRGRRAVGLSRRRRRRRRALPRRRRRRGGALHVRGRPRPPRRRPDPAGVDAVLRRDLPRRAPGARAGGARRAGGAGGGPGDRQPVARCRWATTRWGSSSRSPTRSRRSPSWTRRRGSRRKCRTSGGRASR